MRHGGGDPRRKAPRHKAADVSCDLGEVKDLSATGICICGRGKPPIRVGQRGTVKLSCTEGSLSVPAQAVWIRRVGFRRYELGMKFADLKKSMTAALESLAEFGFFTAAAGGASNATGGQKKSPRPMRAAMRVPDYYSVLGVKPNASPQEIQAAYRALARKYHPDVATEVGAQQKFIAINEAYEVLKDPDRRDAFDARSAA